MNRIFKIKRAKTYAALVLSFVMMVISCNDDDKGFADFNAGGTATEALAGEWFVKLYDLDGEVLSDYFKISSFNTAANTASEIWIQDFEGIIFQSKVNADPSALSFSANEAENIFDETERVTITEGKIFKESAFAIETRTVVDSISFTYASTIFIDPFVVAGHRRTGFQADEP